MCVGCGKTTVTKARRTDSQGLKIWNNAAIVAASDNPADTVIVRFYGGGMVRQVKSGCSGCGGSSVYAMQTTKTISFASEDSPNGVFKMTFEQGHDYPVTQKQAERLLTMTYVNPAGQTVNMFKLIMSGAKK